MENKLSAKEILENFINTLHQYDFYALYWLGALIFFLLILIVIVREKEGLSAFLMLILLSLLFFGAPISYLKIHEYLYGTKYKITYIKQMKFANTLVVKGEITSTGESNISKCKLHTLILPPQDGFLKDIQILFAINPLKKDTFEIDELIEKGESTNFKLKFTKFKHNKDINASDIYIYRECFEKIEIIEK